MNATFINMGTVILGGSLGLLLKKGLPQRISDAVMQALALCVIYIGISGSFDGQNTLIAILSMALGAIVGSALRLDDRLNALGQRIENRLNKNSGEKKVSFAEGFVTSTMLFCVGAMAIVGSLQCGLSGNGETIISKAVIDGISAIVLASTLGVGVLFSAVPILLYQGSITLLAGLLAPLFTEALIAEMSCTGSLLIIAIGTNMLGLTKIKVVDLLPAVLFPILLCSFM